MEFKICENCNMIFQYIGHGEVICPACVQKDDEDCEKIKDFLIENPNAREEEISKGTRISLKSIEKLIKANKIVVKGTNATALTCNMCGISIPSGRYCADCKRKFAMDPGSTGRSGGGMRFIRR
jgi:hypothetical protein